MDKVWQDALSDVIHTPQFEQLSRTIESEYNAHTIYPAKENIFNAINGLNPSDIRVVILGQDPYHEPGEAHGLSFSVENGAYPPSLVNIFKELKSDVGITATSGNLIAWKEQGVLLLNTVLTVRAHQANSHKELGWQMVTEAVLKEVLKQAQYKVFILWGKQADNMFTSVWRGESNVGMLKSAHPSPLSAHRGFFGSQPFSKTNKLLRYHGQKEINWTM